MRVAALQSFPAQLSNKQCEWSFPGNEEPTLAAKTLFGVPILVRFSNSLLPLRSRSRIFQLFEHSCPRITVIAVWHLVCDCKGRKAGLVSKRNYATNDLQKQRGGAVRWFLIDRLEECEAGKRAVAIKAFSRSDLIFMDHFPGHEIVPGVLEIEMIAQTVTACVRLLRPKTFAVLSRVESARFIKQIVPGDQCRITAEIIRMRPHYIQATGYIEVAGKRVGEAQFVAAIVPGVEVDSRDPLIEDWIQRQGGSCEQDSLEASVAAFA